MESKFEKARREWKEAKEKYEACMKMVENSLELLEFHQKDLHEKSDIFMKEQLSILDHNRSDNIVKMPKKKDK